jgi:hypothetical protein
MRRNIVCGKGFEILGNLESKALVDYSVRYSLFELTPVKVGWQFADRLALSCLGTLPRMSQFVEIVKSLCEP